MLLRTRGTAAALLITSSLTLAQPSSAAVAAAPAAAVPAVAAPSPALAGGSAQVTERHASFASAPASGTRSAPSRSSTLRARVARPAAALVTAAVAVPPEVAIVGVSWRRGTGARTFVQYRVREAGSWGSWRAQAPGDCVACETGEEAAARARAGSDPVVLTGAQAVQARLVTASGTAPRDARLSVIDPGRERVTPSGGVVPGGGATMLAGASAASLPTASASASRVGLRSAWRASERVSRTSRFRPVGVVVHHTAGTNRYSRGQVPAILRGIQRFHVQDRGWSDIGYNVLVDKWGRVWEGRRGGVGRPVVGAHASGYNSRLVGISVLGDYNRVRPTRAALSGVAWAAGRAARVHGFDPRAPMTAAGRRMPRLVGHRSVGTTSCPGVYLSAKLPYLRDLSHWYSRR